MKSLAKIIMEAVQVIAVAILLPFILLYKLITTFMGVALVILVVTSPFILIGFIVWMIAK